MKPAQMTNEEIMELFRQCLPLFAVLNDEKRQEIILIVADAKEEGIMVNAITEKVSLSRPAVSHHLKILRQAGIVDVKKKGVESYYYLTLLDSVTRFKELLAAIENSCILV
ncbi:MAG: ArsR family transcriptional regulator, arsenate/arsenite/antimonite-responsive transcriptional [Clostridiales bacterium]|nr:ArsR family transcriptional regulator, arsenate/arsenite/antimonite-responsive transcriptional [Clostridiales bacterium]